MKNLPKIAVALLGLLFCLHVSAQTLPPFPVDPFYDSWSFYDPTNWLSDEGYAPNTYTNIIDDESAWSADDGILNCNGLILDSSDPAWLNYKTVESNNHTNLSCTAGTIWFWFSPDWDSESQGGTGPGDWGRFIDVGAYTTNATFGWWSLFLSPDGNSIFFSGQTNGATTNYLNAPIAWTSGSWHLIGLTYTPTNSILYLDDQVATNGLGVIYPPSHGVLTNGFTIGSDMLSGTQQARGEFVDLESWLVQFPSNEFSAYYDEMLPEFGGTSFGGGGFHTDSFSPPDLGGGGGGGSLPDFSNYSTNLWLYIAGVQSNSIGLFLVNTAPDISYEIQSKTDLTLTNWNSEGFVLGSELTNFTEMDLTQGTRTNNLFMRIRSWVDDGSGIPLWWQQQYFGTNGVDPYGNPAGDGWNNLQKFQNGMNPNVFYTPPAPQGLIVTYNSSNNTAAVTWLPSPGPVTGYTVETPSGNYDVSSNIYSFVDTNLVVAYGDAADNSLFGPLIDGSYQVQALYAGGNSAMSENIPLEADISAPYPDPVQSVNLVAASQGSAYLSMPIIPAGVKSVRLSRSDNYAENVWGNYSFDTNFDISITSFTNGFSLLPASLTISPKDSYGQANYYWWVQLVYSNGSLSAPQSWSPNGGYFGLEYTENQSESYLVPPYFDGRAQLKQNLIFLLRSATVDFPFAFSDIYSGYSINYTNPSNYAYSGFYQLDDPELAEIQGYYGTFDVLHLFQQNAAYRNFVFNSSQLNGSGRLTTGAAGSYDDYFSEPIDFPAPLSLSEPATYLFQTPATNGAAITSLLATGDTQWLGSYPFDSTANYLGEIGITTNGAGTYSMASNARNLFGLPFLSAKIGYNAGGSAGTTTLFAGGSTTQGGNFYPETAQPEFATVEYDFNMAAVPGSPGFSTTNTSSPVIITSVGNPNFSVTGYAKLAVENGYSGVYAYLGQYFDKAYQITNGVVTTNTTGVLSSYGNFFATQPGPVALVTMPDLDTGARGTGVVYAVSLVLDRNHGSNMDLSFDGADATSFSNPDLIWANNNYDRGHTVDGTDFEQDDLGPVDIANGHLVPDCQYTTNGFPAIPCTRDLEDYFRLWLPGVAAAMKAMPANYTVRLTLSGSGQIRVFQAIEPDGGTNYLFDETTASNQVANSTSLYVGLLTSSSPIVFNISTNFNEHFIFCGGTNGSAQIDLQVLDGNGNIVADAPAYLQINEIKQMYERWTVGDDARVAPTSVAAYQIDDFAFRYTPPTDTNTPYILFVHGWNMDAWEKDRYAETAFKRLYWQGYHGRFGSFRWPTGNKFSGIISALIDARNYDNSESNAWASAIGLTNLLTQLNAEYPSHLYLMAHSMGNVVAGEALRLASSQMVNTYVAMQGAVPAHAYDPNTTTRAVVPILGLGGDDGTPNCYAQYYTNGASCYFNASTGAGIYVNFFNTNDYALSTTLWQLDQNLKPDDATTPAYHFVTPSGTHPTGFYRQSGSFETDLYFTANTYELFAYADESRCYALGAQSGVGGKFSGAEVELNIQPYNFGTAHKYHSGEFRSDNPQRWLFWHEVLTQMGLN